MSEGDTKSRVNNFALADRNPEREKYTDKGRQGERKEKREGLIERNGARERY